MSTKVIHTLPHNRRKALLLQLPNLRSILKIKEGRDGSSATSRTESTMNVYIRQIQKIYTAINPNKQLFDDKSIDWIGNHENVIEAIEGLLDTKGEPIKPLTKSCYAAPFSILAQKMGFDDAHKAYSDYIEAKKPTEDELDQTMQNKSPKELEMWVPWNQIVKTRDHLDQIITRTIVDKFKNGRAMTCSDKELVNDHLILSLYTMPLGPLRNEFGSCRILMKKEAVKFDPKPGDMNTCILAEDPKQCQFVISRHKTLNKVGIRKLQIPETLVKVILRSFNLFPRYYLIMKRYYLGFKDIPITNFTPVLNDLGQRYFNKNLSCTLLRHISHTELTPELGSRGEVRKKCEWMGHSLSTAINHYERRWSR
jgi:hypothetical protein